MTILEYVRLNFKKTNKYPELLTLDDWPLWAFQPIPKKHRNSNIIKLGDIKIRILERLDERNVEAYNFDFI